MTMIEDQLAALLKAAPGDPPMSLDPDRLFNTPRPRGRLLAPLLVAATVAALAIGLTFAGGHGDSHAPRAQSAAGGAGGAPGVERLRRAAAVDWVRSVLDHAAVRPGATAGARTVHVSASTFFVSGARTWTAPGSAVAAIVYVRTHSPAGLILDASGPRLRGYRNASDTRSLLYKAATRGGGVRITLTVGARWRPVRPAWSYVRGPVSAVDVTVVRKSPIPGEPGGAPTVHRTLVGPAARRLANLVNAQPLEWPPIGSWCPHSPIRAWDTLLFRTDHGTVEVGVGRYCQEVATITQPGRTSRVDVPITILSKATLAALGLPNNYGESTP